MGVLGFLCAIFIPVFGVIGILTVLGINFTFSLKTIFTVLILLAVFRGILRYGEQACNHYIAFRILAVIRDKVFTVLRPHYFSYTYSINSIYNYGIIYW